MSKKDPQHVTFDISWHALLKLVIMAVAIWAAFTLREIIFMIFVVFIFVAAVNPTVKMLQKYMSRGIAVAFFYVLLLLVAVLLSYLFVPVFIRQVNQLSEIFPNFIASLRPLADSLEGEKYTNLIDSAIENFSGQVQNVGGNFFATIMGFFGGIATLITGFVLSFYLLLEEKNAREFFHQILPADRYQAVYSTLYKISVQLGAWVRGQLTIMLVVAVLNAITYAIIGIPSPLALGIWSGLAEAIPYIGPVLGVLPGIFLALSEESILKLVLVVVLNFFLIQQVQNFYITPKVMGKVVGLSPVLIILAIMVGISLFGVIGAVIALPVAAIISVVVSDWPNLRVLWQQPGSSEEE